MKRKPPLRWDRIVGFITVFVVILFSVIIYTDFKKSSSFETKVTINSSKADKSNADRTDFENLKQEATDSLYAVSGSISSENKNTAVNTDSLKAVVCIDAGHGGSDIGTSYNGKNEKTQVLELAKLVKQCLEKTGVTVVMTRTQDTDMSDEERVKISNSSNAAVLVSLHRNAIENKPDVSGTEVWIHSNKNEKAKRLSNYILDELKTDVGTKIRGIKSGTIKASDENYYINSHSKCTSLILELGFITSRTDDVMFEAKINQTAQAISDGIVKFLTESDKTDASN